jgi:phosphatidylserine synthase
MKNTTKGKIIKGCAVGLDVAAPLAATFTQFPLWVEKSSEATMSGLFLIFAFLSALPFIKQIKAYFKSPSVWVVWVILWVLFIVLQNIINEMIIVCFVGVLSNIVGMCIYKIGKKIGDKADEPEEANKG